MMTPRTTLPPKDRLQPNDPDRADGRAIDENLAVLGAENDDEDDAHPGPQDAIAALDAENGDPLSEEEDEEEPIPLPPETLARGARRP